MSEHIDNHSRRKAALQEVIRQLHEGRSVDEVKGEFADLLQEVGSSEIAEIEQALIDEGLAESEVKRLCDVHVAVFRDSLDTQPSPEAAPGHAVDTFRAENAAAEQVLARLAEAVEDVAKEPKQANRQKALSLLQELREYDKHYLRKENILFPYLEQHSFTGPSAVMWAIHDDIRAGWKQLEILLEEGPDGDQQVYVKQLLDEVFTPLSTAIREMFYKEENILFPTALEKLSDEEWDAIRRQETEIGYAYVEPVQTATVQPPQPPAAVVPAGPGRAQAQVLLNLNTGQLTVDEVDSLLNNLPLDITYVRADDTVAFFSHGLERVFPRTPAIIGRSVQKCHPPASVHRVQQIVDDFRAGRRDAAEFWIQMQGRFVHIRYFAVRDDRGQYQGTVEVVQDVTDIRALRGERRLLDEEE